METELVVTKTGNSWQWSPSQRIVTAGWLPRNLSKGKFEFSFGEFTERL